MTVLTSHLWLGQREYLVTINATPKLSLFICHHSLPDNYSHFTLNDSWLNPSSSNLTFSHSKGLNYKDHIFIRQRPRGYEFCADSVHTIFIVLFRYWPYTRVSFAFLWNTAPIHIGKGSPHTALLGEWCLLWGCLSHQLLPSFWLSPITSSP